MGGFRIEKKNFISFFSGMTALISRFLRRLLSFRYQVEIKGLELLDEK
ncbi:MAG: hypothetical protein LBG52_04760 [Candidatus Peribacteria bacterium]|nr:hypothetical protein [Candidatus Peribacteria bacterium]